METLKENIRGHVDLNGAEHHLLFEKDKVLPCVAEEFSLIFSPLGNVLKKIKLIDRRTLYVLQEVLVKKKNGDVADIRPKKIIRSEQNSHPLFISELSSGITSEQFREMAVARVDELKEHVKKEEEQLNTSLLNQKPDRLVYKKNRLLFLKNCNEDLDILLSEIKQGQAGSIGFGFYDVGGFSTVPLLHFMIEAKEI